MTEPIGFGGYPAAGILGDAPELVQYDRKRGYPWQPWDAMPERYLIGASSIGKPVGDNWENYNRKRDADTAAKHRKVLAEYSRAPDAASFIKEEMWAEARVAMDAGSALHLYTAEVDAGRQPSVPLASESEGHYTAWCEFKARHGLRFGAIERTVFAPDLGAAGTADRIALAEDSDRFRPTELLVLDIKRKNQPVAKVKPSLEHLIQMTALAQATCLAIEEHRELLNLPPIAAGGIVYLCRDGYRCHWIDPHQSDVLDLVRSCIAALRGKWAIHGGAFGFPEVQRLKGDSASQPALIEVPTQGGNAA